MVRRTTQAHSQNSHSGIHDRLIHGELGAHYTTIETSAFQLRLHHTRRVKDCDAANKLKRPATLQSASTEEMLLSSVKIYTNLRVLYRYLTVPPHLDIYASLCRMT